MLSKIHNSIQSSELRKNLSAYLKKAKKEPLVIRAERGNENRVLLDGVLYNKLIEAYENHTDSKELERSVAEDDGKHISLGNIKKKYGV